MARTASPPARATVSATKRASACASAARTRAPTSARRRSGGHTGASTHLAQAPDHLPAQALHEGPELPVRGRLEGPQHLRAPVDAVDVEHAVHEPAAGPEAVRAHHVPGHPA